VIAALLSCLLAASPPVLKPRFFPGWQATNVAFPFVLEDAATGRYRMLYAGSPAGHVNASTWEQWVTLTATSRDGRSWTFPDDYEPVLFAHRFHEGEVADPGTLAARFDSVSAFGASALRERDGYRLWYTGWSGAQEPLAPGLTRDVGYAIGLATSPDGASWTKVEGSAGRGAVLAPGAGGAPDAKGAGQPSVIRDGDTLRLWYECFDGARWRICAASSGDGRSWTKDGVALDADGERAPDALGLRNPVVVRRGDAYELWYQGEGTEAPRFRVLRARSADGRTWTKDVAPVPLEVTPPLAAEERIHVDSVIVLPGGASRVFFARELTTTIETAYGPVTRRNFNIYSDVVPR
jgi:hypothetical protein